MDDGRSGIMHPLYEHATREEEKNLRQDIARACNNLGVSTVESQGNYSGVSGEDAKRLQTQTVRVRT